MKRLSTHGVLSLSLSAALCVLGCGGDSKSGGGAGSGGSGGSSAGGHGGATAGAGGGTGGSGGSDGGAGSGGTGGTAGTAGGAGGGGTGGSAFATFACPPAGTPCKIMALGDDVAIGTQATDALISYGPNNTPPSYSAGSAGYRNLFFQLAKAATKSVAFVGSKSSGTTMADPAAKPHEGTAGATIAMIDASVETVIPAAHPNIVVLTVGAFDLLASLTTPKSALDIVTAYGALIDHILSVDPTVLVVAEIPPPGHSLAGACDAPANVDSAYTTAVKAFAPLARTMINQKSTSTNRHVLPLDVYNTFVFPYGGNNMFCTGLWLAFSTDSTSATYFPSLGLIPNDAGYGFIANRLFLNLTSYLQ